MQRKFIVITRNLNMGNLRTSLATVVVLAVITLLSASCQESLEERCARESREFNEKKCPAKVAEDVMLDSLIFERENHTLPLFINRQGKHQRRPEKNQFLHNNTSDEDRRPERP